MSLYVVENHMEILTCTPKMLPPELHLDAAQTAVEINPANRPAESQLRALEAKGVALPPSHLALLTSRYWGSGGVHLSVSFIEAVAADLRDRILSHMNAWGAFCNAKFSWTQSGGDVRITLQGDGYWSYLGTDVRQIPAGQPTMSLQAFNINTPEAEYRRVVRHETGHTLGFPHEHLRQAIISRLDRSKTIAYGAQVWGWDANMVIAQVLTPIPESDLTATPADQLSIMCYQLPGSITVDGQPIPGGLDIDATDQQLASQVYPLVGPPPPPPPPPPPSGAHGRVQVVALPKGQTPFFDVHMRLLGVFLMGNRPLPRGTYALTASGAAPEVVWTHGGEGR